MNLGQLADAEAPSIAAYKLVKEIEREFKAAADLDEHFDYAGPARCLGLLYRDAPGWPISIGSQRKAREWLEPAVKLAPDYPENHLNLAETCLRWKERDAAERELKALDALWPKAQTNFSGAGLGTELGRLVAPPGRCAQKARGNVHAGENAEKLPLNYEIFCGCRRDRSDYPVD